MAKINWQHWYARWEQMQNCYVPHRVYRFELMLKLANLAREAELKILDLGCGPGSLTFQALRYYPRARVTAVDFDPVMVQMGQAMAQHKGVDDQVQFVEVDLRQTDWWAPYKGAFDLILSATALHWLGKSSLTRVYQQAYRALVPGGQFFNSDHIASDDAGVQARYRDLLHVNQQSAFHVVGADDWEQFWQEIQQALGHTVDRSAEELWEGTDNGLPRQFHRATLRACGFTQVAFHWQELGEAIIGAQKA